MHLRPAAVRAVRFAAAAVLVLAAVPASSPAQTVTCDRVASRSGADTNAGTLAAPFKTAQKLADSLSAGQTGCLREGTYTETSNGYIFKANRSSITLRSYPGEQATLSGTIHIPSTAQAVTLSHLRVIGTGLANVVKVYAEDFTLADSDVTNLSKTYSCIMLGSTSAGAAVRPVIKRNVLHDCGDPATNKDHAIYAAMARDGQILDNIIVNPGAYAVQLYPDAQNMRVAHNVVDGVATIRGGIIIGGNTSVASSNSVVEQNVITYSATSAVTGYWPGPVGTNNISRDNCVYGGGSIGSQVGFKDTGSISADPKFANRAARDYRLGTTSLCLAKVGYDTAAVLAGQAATQPAPAPAPTEPWPTPTEPAPAPAPAPTEPTPTEPAPGQTQNLAPTVTLTSPSAASYLTRHVGFTAGVSDDSGVVKVEYYVDGKLVATSSTSPFSSTWRLPKKLAFGAHQVTAKAYDAQGLSAASAAVTVYR